MEQSGGSKDWFMAAATGNEILLRANLKCGNLKKCKALSSDRNVNELDSSGNSALILATEKNHRNILNILISFETIDVNIINNSGYTALLYACKNKNIDIITQLFAKGAKIVLRSPKLLNLYTTALNNVLQELIKNNQIEILEILIKNGLDVNSIIDLNNSLLVYIVIYNNKSFVEFMLGQPNININYITKLGETALIYAYKNNYVNKAQLLFDKGATIDIKVGPPELLSLYKTKINVLLQDIIKNNKKEILQNLIKNGLDVNSIIDLNKNSILMYAIDSANIDIIKLFLDQPSLKIDYVNFYTSQTALIIAYDKTNIDIMSLLIEKGAKMYIKDNYLYNKMFKDIISKNQKDILRMFVKKDLDLNSIIDESSTYTILMTIFLSDKKDLQQIVLEHQNIKSAINYIDIYGQTVITVVYDRLTDLRKKVDILTILFEKGAEIYTKTFNLNLQQKYTNNINRILQSICKNNQKEILQIFIKYGYDINSSIDEENNTLLMFSIKNRKNDFINDLLKEPIIDKSINIVAKSGQTALTYAIQYDKIEIVSILFKKGGRIKIEISEPVVAQSYKSVLDTTLQDICMTNRKDILQILINNGLDINSQIDKDGNTLFMYAIKNSKNDDFIKVLLSKFTNNHANNNHINKHNTTLLMYAIQYTEHLVKLLLEQPSIVNSINIIANSGDTALTYAVYHNKVEIVSLLFDNGGMIKIETTDPVLAKSYRSKLDTTLQNICQNNRKEILQIFINNGLDINSQIDEDMNTLFMSASINKDEHIDIVKLLLEQPTIRILMKNKQDKNALNLAIDKERYKIIEFFLKEKFYTKSDDDINGILQYVCKNNKINILKIFITSNIDINRTIDTDNDYSILMYAILNSNINMIYFLFSNNVDIEYKNKDGKTALNLAQEKKLSNKIELFKLFKKPSLIIKNGEILSQIDFNKDTFKKQISDDLETFFNISVDLTKIIPDEKNISSSYYLLKSQFTELKMSNVIKNRIRLSHNKLFYTDNSSVPPNIIEFNLVGKLAEGGFNKVSKYTYNDKSYIFREYRKEGNDELFNCFYENLKHLILYIIMCRYNGQIKTIPQPIGIGIYVNNGVEYIGFLSESGKIDFLDSLRAGISDNDIRLICHLIYKDLYMINNVPNMNLCFSHNDMKSENIVLTDDNYPLLIDFGFSFFKINDIIFYGPILSRQYYFNKDNCDRDYNLACDFITLLYTMKYYDYNYAISNDTKSIYFYDNFRFISDKIIRAINKYENKIKNDDVYTVLYDNSNIKQIVKSFNYKLNFENNLFPQMNIDSSRLVLYKRQLYYKKYLKYKQKYLQLQNK